MQDGRIKLVRDAVEDWEGLIDICPTGALRYDASCYDVSDILREVKKDRAFFRYGGGVTLSAEFEAQIHKDNESFYWGMTMTYGFMYYQNEIKWANWCIDKLKEKIG